MGRICGHEEENEMKRKIWLASMISICLVLAACNGEEVQKSIEKESTEQVKGDNVNDYAHALEQDSLELVNEEIEQQYLENLEMTDLKEEKEYITEDYGEIQPYGSEFYYDEETKGFYYNLEMFYLNSDFLYTMNDTLEEFYDGYLKQYQKSEDRYMEKGESDLPEGVVPYSELCFLGIQHVDNDYVSLLFNDVTYMGGAHPYSWYDAITVDRCTGEEVTASEILRESDKEILEKVSDLMGLDGVASWEDIDFYLQNDSIVFFYRMPGYWEDVVLGR